MSPAVPITEERPILERPLGPGVKTPHRRARARDASTRRTERAWEIARRIHLGVRQPANWVELVRFGLVGGTGYVINVTVFAVLLEVGGIHTILAAMCAFVVAVINNFLLNRHWTFQARDGHAGFQAARFFTVSVAALGVNLAVLYALVYVAGAPGLPSQVIAVAAAMPASFVGNKLWTFR